MHPIEKAHKMIIAGNVLSGDGRWVPRNEALKRKCSFLEHVFKGEVEQNGRWVKITDINSKAVSEPIIVPESILSEPVQENPFHGKNLFPAEQDTPATMADSTISQDVPPQKNPRHQAVQQTFHPVPEETPIELLPPRSAVQQEAEQPQHEHLPQKETITIRTIPLGKETTLTISESRAGEALVAICSIQGFLDQTNADDFQAQLMSMLDFGVLYFIIDMEHTTLVGSAGWGVIAISARLIKAGSGRLLICAMKTELEESFLLLQFNEVIDTRKTISDGLDSIREIIRNNEMQPQLQTQDDSYSPFGEAYDELPMPEKIKTIIAQNGPLSFFQLHTLLKQERYGGEKINVFKLFFLLRDLNLDTKWKRVRYYRSC